MATAINNASTKPNCARRDAAASQLKGESNGEFITFDVLRESLRIKPMHAKIIKPKNLSLDLLSDFRVALLFTDLV